MPIGIANYVLHDKLNVGKKQEYVANLETDKYKNKLYHIINITSLNNLDCLNMCLYTNADNIYENLTTKLISTLVNYKDLGELINFISDSPILTYKNRNHLKFLNDKKNLNFFRSAFLPIFLKLSHHNQKI